MKKIPSLFERDFSVKPPRLLKAVTPGCEWVLEGEGRATRKYDGTAVAIIGGELYARYDAKQGKPPPVGAIPCDEPDPVTGHWPHWIKADRPCDKWIRKAHDTLPPFHDGTYEACGPSIGANKEGLDRHMLLRHGHWELDDVERSWEGIKSFLEANKLEGIVFHHPDGRMCKIRRHNFGFSW